MDAKKKTIIEVLKKTMGNVTKACEAAGISRVSFYNWKEADEKFAEEIDSIDEYLLDFAEDALYTKIKKGHLTAIIFFLKTKGKKRGYIERMQVEDLKDPVFKMFDARGMNPDEVENEEEAD